MKNKKTGIFLELVTFIFTTKAPDMEGEPAKFKDSFSCFSSKAYAVGIHYMHCLSNSNEKPQYEFL